MAKILPQYRIEKELNEFGMKKSGAGNILVIEHCLSRFYNSVERGRENIIIAKDLKPNIDCSVKLLVVKCLGDFQRNMINDFDLGTEKTIQDFTKRNQKNDDIPVRLIIADKISPIMKKYCEHRNIEVIYYNLIEQKYRLIWKTTRRKENVV